MLTVHWEFKGDELGELAAQTAVQRILDHYRQTLASTSCPVHGEVPILHVRGRALEDLDLSVESCCQVLTEEVSARIRSDAALKKQ